MRCIYFTGEKCFAGGFRGDYFIYTPNNEEKETFCENLKFNLCPRFEAYLDDKKANK